MRVEFTFDSGTIEKQGHTIQEVYNVIKKNFTAKGLSCVEDAEVLAFTDTGEKKDYINMWAIITKLMNSNWFISSATSCSWYDDDDAEAEDILAQAWKFDLHGKDFSNRGADEKSKKEKGKSRQKGNEVRGTEGKGCSLGCRI